jgi:aminomethyltransferase
MLKQTPLVDAHRKLGARLVGFAGWEMPIHYGSQTEEHHAVRRDAGMFDVSHMLNIDVRGDGVRPFLRSVLANDVDKLREPGRALYTCMLLPEGGVIDDLIAYRLEERHFRLVVNAGTAEKDMDWFRRQLERFGGSVEIVPRHDLAMIAVQGPNARARVWQALPGSEAISAPLKPFSAALFAGSMVARTGYTGEDGFELIVPAAQAPSLWHDLLAAGVKPCGLGARDSLRLEAGMNLYGQDMDESVSPLESGLGWTVECEGEREFTGKAALLARPPERQLIGLVLLDKGVLRAHQPVFTSHGPGEITSGGFSPTMARSIALARIPAPVAAGELVEVEIRQKRFKARAVRAPFVRKGKIMVEEACLTY